MQLGDFRVGDTVDFQFTTSQNGVPATLAGTPVVSIYKDNSTTESTAGVTLTVDHDARTGKHHVRITTASDGTFYSSASEFTAVITTGTVGGLSVVGTVIAAFSLEKRSALRPATAGRQLVVDAAGLADANAVKLGPTGTGTAQTARDIGASVLLSTGTGTGQLDFTAGVVKANLAQILGTALTETAGLLAGGFKKFFNVAAPTGTLNDLPGVVPNASGGLPLVDANIEVKASTLRTNNDKTGYGLSAAAVQAIWDALTSALTTVGSIGKRLADDVDATISSRSTYAGGDTSGTTTLLSRIGAALTITGGKVDVNDKTGFSLSAAGVQAIWDALTSALTTVGSIGKRIADNLDAAISSRSTYAGGDTSGTTTLLARVPGTVQPQTGDSYARLGAPAGASVSADVAAVKSDSAAIKLKTDNLPASPAAVADIAAALDAIIADSIPADGTRPSMRQALYMLAQFMFERSVSGTTVTINKPDGTPLMTFTLNDATTPTALTRTT